MNDPVCGMEVDKNSKFKSSYKDKEYAFCSVSCKLNFDRNPEKYAK